uniref:Uncharacterized protein n=1 Tax=Mycena chlorophos TaxID=658473 RepID=A0ABQ0LBU5_MYCCL|nr:predicted protein [Mycena chlorophos]
MAGTQAGSVEEHIMMGTLERSMAETDHLFADPNPRSGMDFTNLMKMRTTMYSTELGQWSVSLDLPEAQEQQQFLYTVATADPPVDPVEFVSPALASG